MASRFSGNFEGPAQFLISSHLLIPTIKTMKTCLEFAYLKTFLLLLLVVSLTHSSFAQNGKFIHAAFVGIRWDPSPVMGGGMESTEVILYFRPDGTYCTTLGKDWQTDVAGRYTIANGTIKLIDSKNEVESIPYDGNGSFWYNGTSIFQKKPANKVPPGYYSFSYTSGSGGIGSGTNAPYVGNRAHKGIQFNADGSFSSGAASSTYISGENVSGYGNRKKEADGTYTIKGGVLTLHFRNGEKTVNSCFTSDAVSSIIVNGTTYYADENKGNYNKKETKNSQTNTSPESKSSGQAFLKKANQANSGKSLDGIKTVKLESSLGNGALQISTILDIPQQKIRCEYRKQGQLIGIEQADGQTGWEWSNGKLTTLSADRVKELKNTYAPAIFSLQEPALSKVSILSAPENKNNQTSLIVSIDGNYTALLFDKENRLTGKSCQIFNRTVTHAFSGFKKTQELWLPYAVIEKRDNKSFTYQYSSIVLNPLLGAKDWAKP